MTTLHERSAGAIPFCPQEGREPLFLILHSATVRNPRAPLGIPQGRGGIR